MEGLILPGLQDALVIPVALDWPSPDRILEAIGDSAQKRAQRANAAGGDIISDRFRLEQAAQAQIQKRLAQLKQALQQRLLADDGGVTDFRQFTLNQLLADVDRLVKAAGVSLAAVADRDYKAADELGIQAVQEPLAAAQLQVRRQLPGLDRPLVQAAFGNTVDLLTQPMQQYATQVKVAVRAVALAGDSKFGAIAKLRDKIGGPDFDRAQYQAERIIRTELGRVFNQATYDRLVALAQDFPFLRKGWRATKDSRTRLGHRQAGQTYSRGNGIPIAARFQLQVYDERKPGAPKLLGTATLLFPIDPGAQPEGRLAAGATIMCRCNGFVDFALDDFAQFTAAKVQTALGNLKPAPPDKPVGLPKPNKPATVKPKVKVPKVNVPTADDVTPAAAVGISQGGRVSDAILVDGGNMPRYVKRLTAANQAKVRAALAAIDKVHGLGDGDLPTIPVQQVPLRLTKRGTLAFYSRSSVGTPVAMGYGTNVMTYQPYMGVFHETGHFIDNVGITKVKQARAFASEGLPVMDEWSKAVKNSQAMQTIKTWKAGAGRAGSPAGEGVPRGVSERMLDYLLTEKETWARAYAQYVTVKSGNPAALKELRNMQAAATTGKVDQATRYNSKSQGQKPVPGTWDYPVVWSDADFKPIQAAMDNLFRNLGWRSHK